MQMKQRVLLAAVVLSIVFMAHFSSVHVSLHEDMDASTPSPAPRQHVMFLKTHKCASSALQNMFLRYAYNHNLSVAVPAVNNYFGHPAPFQSRFMPVDLLPKSGKVDVFAVHSRLNPAQHLQVLHPDTAFVTAVRDPVSLFESLYNYFNFKYFYGLSLKQFMDLPFEKQASMERPHGKFGPNMMLFDLGYDVQWNTSDIEIKRMISEVDRLFSIVMISERLDESLILLKNLLHWDYSDIILYEKNARREKFKQQLPTKHQMRIRKLSKGDQMLYDYFLERHEKAVEAFGANNMASEVALLRSMRDEMFESCGMKRKAFVAPDEIIFKEYSFFVESLVIDDLTDENCLILSLPELKLLDKMREYQKELLTRKS